MRLPLLITDLDGTLVNLMDEVIAHIYNVTDTPLTPECCKVYSVHDSFAPYLCPPGEPAHFSSVESLNKFLIKTCWLNPNLLRRAKPYWELWRTLLFYKFKGGKVVALTSRNRLGYGVDEATQAWLANWMPLTEVRYAMDSNGKTTAERKLQACLSLTVTNGTGTYVFIDDEPEVAGYVNENKPEGSVVLMPDRPWTREAKVGLEACNAAVAVQNIIADAAEAADG